MKQLFKSFLYAALLLATSASILADCSNDCASDCGSSCSDSCNTDCDRCGCVTIYEPRPAIDNLAFILAGEPPYEPYKECFSGYAFVGYHYDRSMNGCRNTIAKCLFGNDSVQFIGSDVIDTTATSTCATILLADYVGLGVDTDVTWTPCPRIQSHNVDFAFRLNFDEWAQGLWLDIRMPLQIARWQLDLNSSATATDNCDSCSDTCSNDCGSSCGDSCNDCCGGISGDYGTAPFNPGYMDYITTVSPHTAGAGAPTIPVASSIAQAMSGTFAFGDMTGFSYSQWTLNNCNWTHKLADMSFNLGYDFVACDDYHAAAYIRFVAPTGTKINECYAQSFFSPIIGNGHHFELGAGFRSHMVLWNCNDNNQLTAKFEGYITHLFNGKCQVRTFDFAGRGCLSRYMLLKQFTATTASPGYEYDGILISGVDYTTRTVSVDIAAKGEAVLKFEWSWCNWVFGLGAEVWGRTAETICDTSVSDPLEGSKFNPAARYGFKGGTPVWGEGFRTQGGIIDQAVPQDGRNYSGIVSTASDATASTLGSVDSARALINTNTSGAYWPDTRKINLASSTQLIPGTTTVTSIGGVSTAVDVSAQSASVANPTAIATVTGASPVTLPASDVGTSMLDIESGISPRQFTGKVFGDISYRWANCEWQPTLSLFGMGEFAPSRFACALSQWSVGARVGISF